MVAAERPTVSSWPQATTWPVSVKMPTESYSLPPQHTAQMPYQVDSRQPPAPNCPIAQPVAPNCCFAQPIAPHCPVAQPFELTTADMKDSMASGVAFVQLPVNAQQLACALSSAGHYVSLPRVEPAGRLSGGFPQHELPLMQTQPLPPNLPEGVSAFAAVFSSDQKRDYWMDDLVTSNQCSPLAYKIAPLAYTFDTTESYAGYAQPASVPPSPPAFPDASDSSRDVVASDGSHAAIEADTKMLSVNIGATDKPPPSPGNADVSSSMADPTRVNEEDSFEQFWCIRKISWASIVFTCSSVLGGLSYEVTAPSFHILFTLAMVMIGVLGGTLDLYSRPSALP